MLEVIRLLDQVCCCLNKLGVRSPPASLNDMVIYDSRSGRLVPNSCSYYLETVSEDDIPILINNLRNYLYECEGVVTQYKTLYSCFHAIVLFTLCVGVLRLLLINPLLFYLGIGGLLAYYLLFKGLTTINK